MNIDGWQPISTAPKDGELILLFDPSLETFRVIPGSWDTEEDDPAGQCWRDAVFNQDRLHPTHWMPLPPPPVETPATR